MRKLFLGIFLGTLGFVATSMPADRRGNQGQGGLPQILPVISTMPLSGVINIGEHATLTASGAFDSWIWSTGETAGSITVAPLTTTDYWLKGITNLGGGTYDTTAAVYITITVNKEPDLQIPNVITPNNTPGLNDEFKIPKLETYMENELFIYNRWMSLVYHKKQYDNKWRGENVSEGVYYYLLRARKQTGEDVYYKGFIQVIK